MMVALGKGETDEYKDNLHKVGTSYGPELHLIVHV